MYAMMTHQHTQATGYQSEVTLEIINVVQSLMKSYWQILSVKSSFVKMWHKETLSQQR